MDFFCQRFKELKKEKKATYDEIADLLNLTVRSVKNYSSGTNKPDFLNLICLADFFGVSIDYLTGRTNTRTNNSESTELVSIFETLSYETQNCLIAIAKELLVAQEQILYNERKGKKPESHIFAPPSLAAKGDGVKPVDAEAYDDFEKLHNAVKENDDKE